MTDLRPTYEIAKEQIRAYVQPLWPGALALPFDIRDDEGRPLRLADDFLSGRYLVLIFLNDCRPETAIPLMRAFAARATDFEDCDSTVIAIPSSSHARRNRELRQESGFPWPVAGDSTGAVFASYGLHKDNDIAARVVLITPYRQVRTWFDAIDDHDKLLGDVMQILENSRASEEARWSAPHAPVLLVPNVLSPEECGRVIESFETGGPFTVRPPRAGEIDGDYKIPVYEHNRQDRVDHIIKNRDLLQFLDERLWGRVTPMVKKAFAFDVTRREDLHIARYTGERGGNEMGHRDNTSASTAYRRFALSMALNDDYEGGEIVFREYSPRGYRPSAGTALVFSSSLLHEVMETTSGVRYNLISHLFNEDALAGK